MLRPVQQVSLAPRVDILKAVLARLAPVLLILRAFMVEGTCFLHEG
jgi:hypothetical protein